MLNLKNWVVYQIKAISKKYSIGRISKKVVFDVKILRLQAKEEQLKLRRENCCILQNCSCFRIFRHLY